MASVWRTAALVVVVLAIVALAVIAYARRPGIQVEVQAVDRGPMQTTVEAEGKTRVHDRYIVSATVAGRLGRVDLLEGDRVTQGQVVARIDPLPTVSTIDQDEALLREIAAEREQAGAQLNAAIAQAEQASRDLRRARRLFANDAIPRSNLEAAELASATRESDVRAALHVLSAYDAQASSTQAHLEKLRQDIVYTLLRAPVDGSVLRVLQKSEDYVAAGGPVIEIGDTSSLELVIEMLSTDAIDVKPGAAIIVDDGSNTWAYRGIVKYVEPSAFTKVSALGVEEQRVNVIGRFTGPHAGFGDAYRIDARIVTWQTSNAPRLPSSALFRCQSAWCVYTVQDGKATLRHVRVAHVGDQWAQLLGGVGEETNVIVYPSDQISDGTKVSVTHQ